MDSNTLVDNSIRSYFDKDEWISLSDVEKKRYYNLKRNYEFLMSAGFVSKRPQFMQIRKKLKTTTVKTSSEKDAEEESLNIEEKLVPINMTKPREDTKECKANGKIAKIGQKAKNIIALLLKASETNLKCLDLMVQEEELSIEEEYKTENEQKTDARRYPKRSVAKKCYAEEALSSDDEYLYCDDCGKAYNGDCPTHGPMFFVKDRKVKVGSTKDRARKTLPSFLSIGFSGVKKAGLGVWTEVELPKNVVFGPYQGTNVKDFKEAQKSGYAWQIRKGGKAHHYVEGWDQSRSNWLRFVNCADCEELQNLVAFQYKGRIYYRTFRDVLPFTELFVWYGDEYAKDLGIELKRKEAVQEPVSVTRAFECDVCHRLFSSEAFLSGHKRHHRGTRPDARHRCPACDYSTDDKSQLARHLRTHTREKPHACTHCGKGFAQLQHLKDHLRIHSGETPFGCEDCGRRFNRKSSLRKHRLIHMNEKPHVCDACGKGFSEPGSLARHKRTHSGQRPFKCGHCEYRSAEKGHLKTHVISRHTKEYPHVCPGCGKGFTAQRDYKNHLARKGCVTERED